MDRSLAGRLGIGGLPRQPARARQGASAARRPQRRPPARRRPANVLDTALGRLAALIGAGWRLSGDGWSCVGRRRRLRRAAIAALVAMALLAGGWLWLRGSSL